VAAASSAASSASPVLEGNILIITLARNFAQ
jgi:hypothetical protein